MAKTPLSLHVEDVTTFSRALSKQLGAASPPHLRLMNMVARAAGFQNLQHMRAAQAARGRLDSRADPAPADARTVERALAQFDAEGRLLRWPSRRAVQTLALWALWATLPADTALTEKAVNAHLADEHLFGDAATLRRTMISCGLMTRNRDGSDYRRVEGKPPAEALAVMRALQPRRQTRTQIDGRGQDA